MYFIGHLSKRFLLFLAAVVLLIFSLILFTTLSPDAASTGASVVLTADSDAARGEFLASYGWQVTTVPEEVVEVILPGEFNSIYEKYNDLQIAQGFDLRPFKGKTVKRYTYRINNYPDVTDTVYANILMFEGEVIGGDICTRALDGFMHGFSMEETGIIKPTFYQAVNQ